MFRKWLVLIVFVCLFVSTAFAQEMPAPEVLIYGVFRASYGCRTY
ncbi:MAG: hypothetical protein U0694_13150 [Anaerolineae bacterium]